MVNKDTDKNLDTKKSKYDDVFGATVIIIYITGLLMFGGYIIKSVSDMAKRNREKSANQENVVLPKNTNQMNVVNFVKQIVR